MAKTKRKHLASLAAQREASSAENKHVSSSSVQEADLLNEMDSWIKVKKQRVIILIPSLPVANTEHREIESVCEIGNACSGRTSAKKKTSASIGARQLYRSGKKSLKQKRQNYVASTEENKSLDNNLADDNLHNKVAAENLPKNQAGSSQEVTVLDVSKPPTELLSHQDEEPLAAGREALEKVQPPSDRKLPDRNMLQAYQNKQKYFESPEQREHQIRTKEMLEVHYLGMQTKVVKQGSKEATGFPVQNGTLVTLANDSYGSNKFKIVRKDDSIPGESPKLLSLSKAKTSSFQHRPLVGSSSMISASPLASTKFEQHGGTNTIHTDMKSGRQLRNVNLQNDDKTHPSNIRMKDGYDHRHSETQSHDQANCITAFAPGMQAKKAVLVKKKLENAGGLANWLVSLGLEMFVDIFHRERIQEIDLLELNMDTLREMGAHAVGPRRKLIHAIDQLSQPYYFRAL